MATNFDTQPSSSITLATSVPENKRSRTRAILWTLYNYEPYLQQLREFAKNDTQYTCFGYELCPTTQRPHLQGYSYFTNPRSYPNKHFRNTFKGIHDAIPMGSPKQNRDYCLKIRPNDTPNEKFEEFGILPQQGERTDWQAAINHLHNGNDIQTVVSEQPHLLPSIRALQTYKSLITKSIHRDVKVILLVGAPGTGKTRWAYDNYPELYSKPEGNWWDGYTGQETILLDDYYGDIPYSQFLKVLDRYPLNLQVKGGFIGARYTTVIITSNKAFTQWYHEPNNAIARRIHQIINLDEEHKHADEETISQEARNSQAL